ncbi:universal stress protein [Streptomyces sp. Tu 3180]|uniref:universal stress protein n=1 Tax=Streptomyces sp. Tu 3180 TaxID=2682611 RepID=UPI001358B333|nr:universal stress protein [Streptomyces sp. Tu 3180]
MVLPLVVGVDGSEGSLLAVDWAVDEAARHGLPLRLVHASRGERHEGALPRTSRERSAEQVTARHLVVSAEERVRRRNPGLEVSAEILPEEAASALLREGNDAFALVTGSRGRGELRGVLLGSVGPAVAARASCPVVVVRGDKAGLAGTHERILLGAGDPGTSGETVRFAFREAEARGCELHVVRAWRCPAYENADHSAPAADPAHRHEEQALALVDALVAEASADHPAVRVHRAAAEGPAHKVLVHRSAAADLVVVGARRRSGHFGLRLGRVSHTLLHHAACPVAVVPQRA